MNHHRLINSSIPTRIVVPVLTHRFDWYKEVFLRPYIQKSRSGTTKHTRSHMAPYKRITQPKNFTSNIRATKHLATCITIVMIVLHSFPQCNAKEVLILVMPNYDPPTVQHNDHNQTYHRRNIIVSHDETARTKCTRQ